MKVEAPAVEVALFPVLAPADLPPRPLPVVEEGPAATVAGALERLPAFPPCALPREEEVPVAAVVSLLEVPFRLLPLPLPFPWEEVEVMSFAAGAG